MVVRRLRDLDNTDLIAQAKTEIPKHQDLAS